MRTRTLCALFLLGLMFLECSQALTESEKLSLEKRKDKDQLRKKKAHKGLFKTKKDLLQCDEAPLNPIAQDCPGVGKAGVWKQWVPVAPNGCGPGDNSKVWSKVGHLLLDVELFQSCCNEHDKCYQGCDGTALQKPTCDNNLAACLSATCDSKYGGGGFVNTVEKTGCNALAATFGAAVKREGCFFFKDGKGLHCCQQ